MRPRTALSIRLERPLHVICPPASTKNLRRNLNSNQPLPRVSTNVAASTDGFVTAEMVCYSPFPCELKRRVSPRSFPQLWKKMWKSQDFRLA